MAKCAAGVACLMLTAFAASPLTQQPQPPARPGPALPPPPAAKTGNPTPGTPQPEPPNIADRIALKGCVMMAGIAPSNLQAVLSAAPSLSKFVLEHATKESRVPPGTGTSAAAAAPAVKTYHLEALESQLSPFLGSQVEISGEVKTAGGIAVLLVEFVTRVRATCE